MTVNVNGYPNPHNLAINKTFDKTLIEAQQTGHLCLSSRSLREFPACTQFDLSDTVTADLSKNRLGSVPEQVCSWASLQKLDLYCNVIKSITDSVISLRSLTFLNLSRNYLSVLPAALCQLAELQILLVSHNKLVSLPEEIGHMKSLMELDASCNQLTHLPPQIGHLRSLKVLNLRRNFIVEMPVEISYLGLVHLDISGNRISTIPPELRLVTSLVTLSILDNPLTSPPAQLCTRGKVHVFKYLEMLAQREEKKKGILAREAAADPVVSASNSSGMGLPRRATVATMMMNPAMASSSSLGNSNRYRHMNGDRSEPDAFPPPPPPPRTLDLRQSAMSSGENGSYPSTPSTLSPGDPNIVVGSLEEEISKELFRMRHAPGSPHRTSSPKKIPPPLPTSPPPPLRVKRSNSIKMQPQMTQQMPQPQVRSSQPQIPGPEMETQYLDANRNPAMPPTMGSNASVGVPIPAPGQIQTYRQYKEALRLQRMGPTRNNGFTLPETNGSAVTNQQAQQQQQQQEQPKTAIYGYVNARASPVKAVLYDGDGPPSQALVPGVPQTVYSQPTAVVTSPTATPTGIATAPASKLSSQFKKPQPVTNQPPRLKNSNQSLRGSNSSLASVASSTASSSMIPKSGVKKIGTTRLAGNASHYGPGSTQTLGRRPTGMYSGVKSASNLSQGTSRIGGPQTAPNATPNLSKMRVVNSTSTLDRGKRAGLTASSNSSLNPTATMKREWEKVKAEKDRLGEMRKSIEARLKISLPEDLPKALVDGVVLCHLANHIRPRSVASIHVPSPAVPKLTLAKCRKNVENFLDACRRLGIPEDCICTAGDVLESKNTSKLAELLGALLRTTPAPRVKH